MATTDFTSLARFSARPYRNILHEFNDYNYTIILRQVSHASVGTFEKYSSYPPSWSQFDDPTKNITLAATGGTYNFKNSFYNLIKPQPIGDCFIEGMTIKADLSLLNGFVTDYSQRNAWTIHLMIREANGFSLFDAMTLSFTKLNPQAKSVSSITDTFFLISVYFNTNDVDNPYYKDLKDSTLHIPVHMMNGKTDITSAGTKYDLEMYPFYFNSEYVLTKTPQYWKATELEPKKYCTINPQVQDYLQDLIDKMNDNEKAATTSASNKPVTTYAMRPIAGCDLAKKFWESELAASAVDNIGSTKMTDIETALEATYGAINGVPDTATPTTTSYVNTNQVLSTWLQGQGLNPSLKITQLAIAQVVAFGPTMINATKGKIGNSNPSLGTSAMGAYQMIYTNISSYAAKAGLSTSELFSPANQDKIAKALWNDVRGNFKTIDSTWSGIFSSVFDYSTIDLGITGDPNHNDPNRPQQKIFNHESGGNYDALFQVSSAGSSAAESRATDAATAAKSLAKFQDNLRNLANGVLKIHIAQEMTVENIVKKFLLNSKFYLDYWLAGNGDSAPASTPIVKVFPTVVFDTPAAGQNRLSKTVTYNIFVCEHPTNANSTNATPDQLAKQLKALSLREYDYLFTGKNIDIIHLNLSFDNAALYITPFIKNDQPLQAAQGAATNPADSDTVDIPDIGTLNPTPKGAIPNVSTLFDGSLRLARGWPTNISGNINPEQYYFSMISPLTDRTLQELQMEIVGDPELFPKAVTMVTPEMLDNYYQQTVQAQQIAPASVISNLSPGYFLFTIGSSANGEQNNMYSGFYRYRTLMFNFKEHGAFTINVTAERDQSLSQFNAAQKAKP